MVDVSDDQLDELLRGAEQRLENNVRSAIIAAPDTPSATEVELSALPSGKSPNASRSADLVVRQVSKGEAKSNPQSKDTAGPEWFNLPKTVMTPDFKRDWQVLRMRNILDPKHQKKALRATAPEYSQVGEIIAGPTEFYSARLSRKEKKRTVLEEVMSSHDSSKFTSKYAGIQKQKTSGKRGFYKKLQSQRRRN